MDQPPPSGNPQLSAHMDHNRFVGRTRVAYFSMEIAISPEMPTYSGGLGILAGDDLDLPIVFVTLISRAGYVRQELDAAGRQADVPDPWDPQLWARPLPAMVAVPIVERAVWVRPRLHILQCPTGGAVPILLLDTDASENDPDDRGITSRLYGGDATLRLKQEIVLGIGGEMLHALGFEIATYHLNEGHAALLPLTLLRRYPQAGGHLPLRPAAGARALCVHDPYSGRRGPLPVRL
jgi:starch phosphorylase